MDSGGWFLVKEFISRMNRNVFADYRGGSVKLALKAWVNYATHGFGSDQKHCWQFCVLRRQQLATVGEPYLKIIVRVCLDCVCACGAHWADISER